jgi:integrase/recombinase XerD
MNNVNQRKQNFDKYIKEVQNWKIQDSEKKQVLKFFKDYEIGKITNNIADKCTLEHYVIELKVALEFINKSAENITEKDIDKFSNVLLRDEIISRHKTPFASSVKAKIRRILLQYLQWRIPKKTGAINSSLKVKNKYKNSDYKYLTEDEIDILYKNCKDNAERYLIAVLFSSGARASEFYNIKFSDIKLPEKDENFVQLTLREEFSKTKGRTIRLYYKNALEAVSDFLKDRKKEGIKPEDIVWNLKSTTTQKKIESFGKVDWLKYKNKRMVLDKHLNLHMFRHSSATWMANKLNHQEMCYFFGWKFSSPMPDIYISRKGMKMEQADKKFEQTELSELKSKLNKQDYENKLKNEDFEKMKKVITELQNNYDDLAGKVAVRELEEDDKFGSISDEGMLPPKEEAIKLNKAMKIKVK